MHLLFSLLHFDFHWKYHLKNLYYFLNYSILPPPSSLLPIDFGVLVPFLAISLGDIVPFLAIGLAELVPFLAVYLGNLVPFLESDLGNNVLLLSLAPPLCQHSTCKWYN